MSKKQNRQILLSEAVGCSISDIFTEYSSRNYCILEIVNSLIQSERPLGERSILKCLICNMQSTICNKKIWKLLDGKLTRKTPYFWYTSAQTIMTAKIGKYDILEVLGRGGMGVVYKAYDPILDREVALKTMTAEGLKDPVLRERFYREARAAGRLRHPNIVTIYELGEQEEVPYIGMEYLHGTDIHQLIKSKDNVPFESKIRIVAQLCRGLAYAHRSGIVHRDIKPSNIRLTEDYQVKILDFGIARLVTSQTMTTNGMVLGTIHYMSPEQIKGTHVDRKSDIFSAGIILYEFLTFRKPFEGESTATVLYNILHQPPHPMHPPVDEQFPPLKKILRRALDKDPARRYFSADEMADHLEEFLGQYAMGTRLGSAPTMEYVLPSRVEEEPKPEFVEKTPEKHKTDPRAQDLLRTAKRHVMEGHPVQAASHLKQALEIDPQYPEARQLMEIVDHDIKKAESDELLKQGQNYLREGRYDIALKVFEKILKLEPNHSKAKMLLDTLKTEMIPEIEELLEKAKNAYAEKKYHLSRKYIEEVLKSVPEHQEAQEIMIVLKERLLNEEFNEFMQSAESFIHEQQYETAMKALEKALRLFPQHPVALKWMNDVEQSLKRGQIDQYRSRGNKQLELGNYEEAKETFGNILKIEPKNETARMVIAHIEQKIRGEEIKQLLNLGWRTLMMDRQFEEVIRIGEKILSLDPENAEAKSLISQAQKELNHKVENT
jgi:eukaryotic-like serine/threonine-protein kinase